jgi:hypothetical protein
VARRRDNGHSRRGVRIRNAKERARSWLGLIKSAQKMPAKTGDRLYHRERCATDAIPWRMTS